MGATATLGLDKDRLESLTDGIFATVMTVLVLSLSLPTIIASTDSAVATYLVGLGPTILSYVMSFLILAVFWVRHHNVFHFISRVDNSLIWLNMLFLLTIGFVPFSTEIIGRFWNTEVATVVYGSNLIASGLSFHAVWTLAVRRNLLTVETVDEQTMAQVNRRLLGGPSLYALAIVCAFVLPHGTQISVGIFVLTLAYYVLAGSLSRRPFWKGLVSRQNESR